MSGATIKKVAVPDSAILSYARQQGLPDQVATKRYMDQMIQQRETDTFVPQESIKQRAAEQIEGCLRDQWDVVTRDGSTVFFTYGGVTYRVDVSTARK